MAIISYIPPVKKIKDKRTENGGYYVAKCDVCNTEFYPMKSNAKYCSSHCTTVANRRKTKPKAVKATTIEKPAEVEVKPSEVVEKPIVVVEKQPNPTAGSKYRGYTGLYAHLKKSYNTRGMKDEIVKTLQNTKIGSTYTFQNEVFRRESQMTWISV